MKKLFVILLVSVLLISCSSTQRMNGFVESHNVQMAAAKKPTRAAYKTSSNGSSNMKFGVWAGKPGVTAASPQYQEVIFNYFDEKCGFKKSALKEVRVVSHEPPTWYEVWVFNDEKSERSDKTFGRSVVFKYLQESNTTHLNIIEECKPKI